MMKRLKLVCSMMLVTSLSGPVLAEEYDVPTLRCGNGLLKVGDSTAKMIKDCGKPIFSEDIQSAMGGVIATKYHFQKNRRGPATMVMIQAGKVTRITQTR